MRPSTLHPACVHLASVCRRPGLQLTCTACAAGALRLELATSPKSLYLNGPQHAESAPLRAVADAMPKWTALAATISFQSVWRFP